MVSHLVSTPPSEGLFIRYLTMRTHDDLGYCNIIESPREKWDETYYLLNQAKIWDFFYDFVEPEWKIEGVRLDTELNYPLTIKANYIRCENTLSLLGQLEVIRHIR